MEARYYTLSISLHRFADSYQVELSHSDPASQAQVAPLRGGAALDPAALLGLQGNPASYGRTLAEQLFSDRDVKQRFVQVETAAQASGASLRLSLVIDPSAQELQALRWELLRHPETGATLTTSETLLLSRFMVSRDFRPIKLRARSELTGVIAVAAPPAASLQQRGLAAVDFEGEVSRVRAANHESPPFSKRRSIL